MPSKPKANGPSKPTNGKASKRDVYLATLRDKKMRGEDGLTPRERAFAEAYLTNGFNITQAAKAAGFKCTSGTTFCLSGGDQLKKPLVRQFINDHLSQVRMSSEEVVGRLEEQIKANPADFFDERWRLNRKAVRERGHLIKKLKCPQRGKPAEIELHDAQAALMRVGATLGLFNERIQHIGDPNQPITHEFTVNVAAAEVGATGPKLIKDAVIDVKAEAKP